MLDSGAMLCDSPKRILLSSRFPTFPLSTQAVWPYRWPTFIWQKRPKKKTAQKKAERASIELDPKILTAYEGLYKIRPDYVLTIKIQNGQLTVQGTGGSKYVLYAESERSFFRRNANFEITFNINNVGAITKITIQDNGREIEGIKFTPIHLNSDQLAEYTGEYYSPELDTFTGLFWLKTVLSPHTGNMTIFLLIYYSHINSEPGINLF